MTDPQTEVRATVEHAVTRAVYNAVKDSVRDFADFNQVYEDIHRALATALTAQADELERTKQWYVDAIEQRDKYSSLWSDAEARAERALAERAGGVKVKALEWEDATSPLVGPDVYYSRAATEFGSYRTEQRLPTSWMITTPNGDAICDRAGQLAHHETLDAAKAAAQADYERRILSALTAEPAAPEDDKPTLYETLLMNAGASREGARRLQRGDTVPEEGQDAVAYGVLPEFTLSRAGSDVTLAFSSGVDADFAYDILEAHGAYTRPAEQAVTDALLRDVREDLFAWMQSFPDADHGASENLVERITAALAQKEEGR